MTDEHHDPAHPLRNWIPDPIPRREPSPGAELERLALSAETLAASLRALAQRISAGGG